MSAPYLNIGGAQGYNSFALGQTVTLSIANAPQDILRVEYVVRGTDELVTPTMINTINSALGFNLNPTNWSSYFTNPSDALSSAGRGILIGCRVYLLDGSTLDLTGIAYTKTATAQTLMPLIAGQMSETGQYGWIPQANAQIRYGGDPAIGIRVPVIGAPSVLTYSEAPTGPVCLWWDPASKKLIIAEPGTNNLYEISSTTISW